MAVIADERLERLAEVVGSRKVTPAAIRVVDVPGRAEIPGNLRQSDALLAVLDGFSERADPATDLETLRSSSRRRPRARRAAARARDQGGEVGRPREAPGGRADRRLLEHLDEGKPLSEWRASSRPSWSP